MRRGGRTTTLHGEARFLSQLFSNEWHLAQGDRTLARLARIPRRHSSSALLTDGTELTLAPEGWGTVIARDADGEEHARIVRRSWWGRTWEVEAPGFTCLLTSDPLPRRWTMRFGSEPVGRLVGGLVTYNSIDVHTDIAVPVVSLIQAWHVIARPWEQAASPGSLVARPAPPENDPWSSL
jgi:hypothetical protein